jgi:CubicO group peptidase (beta-lactamase class C family)
LTHTGGLGDVALARQPGHTPPTTLSGQMAEIMRAPLQYTPGTQHVYSNDGYIVLGAIIEEVSGQSYVDYIHEHIFKPANMAHTAILSYRPSEVPGMARGYTKGTGQSGWAENDELEIANPSGGAYSTAGDLYNFARALLNHKLLSKEYTDIVTTGKVDTHRPGPASSDKYGYGFNERVINGVRIIGHNGGNPGYEAQLDLYPDKGYIVILLANQGRALLPTIQKAEAVLTK